MPLELKAVDSKAQLKEYIISVKKFIKTMHAGYPHFMTMNGHFIILKKIRRCRIVKP